MWCTTENNLIILECISPVVCGSTPHMSTPKKFCLRRKLLKRKDPFFKRLIFFSVVSGNKQKPTTLNQEILT